MLTKPASLKARPMPEVFHPLPDRLTALALLGQARWLEWQALAVQSALIEWGGMRQDLDYLRPLFAGLGEDSFGLSPVWTFADITSAWCLWSVRGQLAAAQELIHHCALPYLDLPHIAGRRAGFDPGRRRSAVVIDFPDRRRPEP